MLGSRESFGALGFGDGSVTVTAPVIVFLLRKKMMTDATAAIATTGSNSREDPNGVWLMICDVGETALKLTVEERICV
jgi:hypothetical protein